MVSNLIKTADSNISLYSLLSFSLWGRFQGGLRIVPNETQPKGGMKRLRCSKRCSRCGDETLGCLPRRPSGSRAALGVSPAFLTLALEHSVLVHCIPYDMSRKSFAIVGRVWTMVLGRVKACHTYIAVSVRKQTALVEVR